MNRPCPIHNGHGGPRVEIAKPRPIISAPQITVQRVPTRSAMRPIMMPPMPEPSQASALASDGIERMPSTSLAMSLSATAVIQAAPNAISMVNSATEATTQDRLLSIEDGGDCKSEGTRLAIPSTDRTNLTTHVSEGLVYVLHCAKMRETPSGRNFLLGLTADNEIDRRTLQCEVFVGFLRFCFPPPQTI